jgi:hypothetical protein
VIDESATQDSNAPIPILFSIEGELKETAERFIHPLNAESFISVTILPISTRNGLRLS